MLLSFGLLSNISFAQVEINNSGVLGIGHINDNVCGFPIAKNVFPCIPYFFAGVLGEDRLLKINEAISLEVHVEKFEVELGVNI